MKGNSMSGRSRLVDLGEEFPRLTEKEIDALICVHPYLDGLTHVDAALELGISKSSLEGRIHNAFKKIPWLQEDMKKKRAETANRKRRIRNPIRLGDMSSVGNDGTNDTFFGEKIVGKF